MTDDEWCSSRLISFLNHDMKIPANGLVTRLKRGNGRFNQENKWDSLKAGTWQIIFGEFSPQSACPHQKEKKQIRNLQLFLSRVVETIQRKFIVQKYQTQSTSNSLFHGLEDVSSFQLLLYSLSQHSG